MVIPHKHKIERNGNLTYPGICCAEEQSKSKSKSKSKKAEILGLETRCMIREYDSFNLFSSANIQYMHAEKAARKIIQQLL